MVDAYSAYQFLILLALVFHVSLEPNVRAVELDEFEMSFYCPQLGLSILLTLKKKFAIILWIRGFRTL